MRMVLAAFIEKVLVVEGEYAVGDLEREAADVLLDVLTSVDSISITATQSVSCACYGVDSNPAPRGVRRTQYHQYYRKPTYGYSFPAKRSSDPYFGSVLFAKAVQNRVISADATKTSFSFSSHMNCGRLCMVSYPL
jgi:hypothetical protein